MKGNEFNWVPILVQALGIIVTGIFSCILYLLHRRKNREDAKMQKPLVNVHNFKDTGYVILNMGKGPALNVRFTESDTGNTWKTGYIGYALPVNTYFSTQGFFNNNGAIAVAYNDLLGNDYLMITRGDTSTIWQRGDEGFNNDLYKHLHTEPRRTDKLQMLGKI